MKKALPFILLIVLAVVTLAIKQCNSADKNEKQTSKDKKQEKAEDQKKHYNNRGLNRNPANISYSKHARCRMDCRHIDEAEVKQVLQKGEINYKKSELKGEDCQKKYAVEGTTKDNQKVRIIFVSCANEIKVVTVIDLGKEWVCDCE